MGAVHAASGQVPEPFFELETAMRERGLMVGRRGARRLLAQKLYAQGMSDADLSLLYDYACDTRAGNPTGLVMRWLETGWRDAVDDIHAHLSWKRSRQSDHTISPASEDYKVRTRAFLRDPEAARRGDFSAGLRP